ncbi:unnamed protein product [Sphagnum jensenii]|uniref:Uncharacterized protein n=1 Tax=Sphagnum jensenii TaxID=128206 RepID=A0ABP0VFP0_9BRYO
MSGALLLGTISASLVSPFPNPSIAAQSYLTEPTTDFLEEQQRTAELKKQQINIRKIWDSIIEEIKASDSPATTEAALKKLNKLLATIETIPTGVKKLDLVKTCRAQKFEGQGRKVRIKKTWTKDVEIAYEALIQQFNRQANPKNIVSAFKMNNPTIAHFADREINRFNSG